MIAAYLWSCLAVLLIVLWLGWRSGELGVLIRNVGRGVADLIADTVPLWAVLIWPLILVGNAVSRQREVARHSWLRKTRLEREAFVRAHNPDARFWRWGRVRMMRLRRDQAVLPAALYQSPRKSVFARPTLWLECGGYAVAIALL